MCVQLPPRLDAGSCGISARSLLVSLTRCVSNYLATSSKAYEQRCTDALQVLLALLKGTTIERKNTKAWLSEPGTVDVLFSAACEVSVDLIFNFAGKVSLPTAQLRFLRCTCSG